jgi:uncharacterized protein YidB (DUF937 family)
VIVVLMVVIPCNTWVGVRQFNGVIHGYQVNTCIIWKQLEAIADKYALGELFMLHPKDTD